MTYGEYKVLIANDEEIQLIILENLFKSCNFQVQCSKNGYDAFIKVKENMSTGSRPYDLILLDLTMPISDGYEAIKNIKSCYDSPKLLIAKNVSKDSLCANTMQ